MLIEGQDTFYIAHGLSLAGLFTIAMQPSNVNLLSPAAEQNIRRTAQQPQDAAAITRSLSGIRRLRSDGT